MVSAKHLVLVSSVLRFPFSTLEKKHLQQRVLLVDNPEFDQTRFSEAFLSCLEYVRVSEVESQNLERQEFGYGAVTRWTLAFNEGWSPEFPGTNLLLKEACQDFHRQRREYLEFKRVLRDRLGVPVGWTWKEHFHYYEAASPLAADLPIFEEHVDAGALGIIGTPRWNDEPTFAGFTAEGVVPSGCAHCWLIMVGAAFGQREPVAHALTLPVGTKSRVWIGSMGVPQDPLPTLDCDMDEIHCWARCMKVDSACLTEGYANAETQCTSKDGQPIPPEHHSDMARPTCRALLEMPPKDSGFCASPARSMFMQGFQFAAFDRELPCLLVFFQSWSLQSWSAFGLAIFMLGVLACVQEGLKSEKNKLPPLVHYGLVTGLGYLLMLVPMTYSYELMGSLLVAIFLGNLVCTRPPPLRNASEDGLPLLPKPSKQPCC